MFAYILCYVDYTVLNAILEIKSLKRWSDSVSDAAKLAQGIKQQAPVKSFRNECLVWSLDADILHGRVVHKSKEKLLFFDFLLSHDISWVLMISYFVFMAIPTNCWSHFPN